MLSFCYLTLFIYTHASFTVRGSESFSSFGLYFCLFVSFFSKFLVSLIYLSFLKSLQELRHSLSLVPLQKTLNLSESVKNSILTAEGVLLLMCVLLPGTMLLCKVRHTDRVMLIQHIGCIPDRTLNKQINKVIP